MMNNLLILDAATTNFCHDAASIFQLVGYMVLILQIAIPIIIIVLGMLDLGKAVMAGDDKEIKENQKMLIKRILYGVLVFFVVTIVKVVFSLVSNTFDTTAVCWKCATGPSSSECTTWVPCSREGNCATTTPNP